MWSFRKQQYLNGPNLPHDFDYKHGCIMAINRTFVMLITAKLIHESDFAGNCPMTHHNYNDYNANGWAYGFDFGSWKWVKMGRIELVQLTCNQRRYHVTCSALDTKRERYHRYLENLIVQGKSSKKIDNRKYLS